MPTYTPLTSRDFMMSTEKTISTFIPPVRILMGPGSSDVHPRILNVMARSTIGHLDPEFVGLMDEMKQLLQYAFQTKNELTIPVSAPGSAGMETCFVNLIEPGDTVIVCQNGVFGGRMKENVERIGATAVMVEDEWGMPVSPEKLEAALKANPAAEVATAKRQATTSPLRDTVIPTMQVAPTPTPGVPYEFRASRVSFDVAANRLETTVAVRWKWLERALIHVPCLGAVPVARARQGQPAHNSR